MKEKEETRFYPPLPHFRQEGGSEVIFACLAHMKVPSIDKQPLFSLSFEGWPSDNFPIEVYRRNFVKIWLFWSIFFCFLTLHAQKLVQTVETNGL